MLPEDARSHILMKWDLERFDVRYWRAKAWAGRERDLASELRRLADAASGGGDDAAGAGTGASASASWLLRGT